MVKIVVVDKNNLFVESLKIALETDELIKVTGKAESLDDLESILPHTNPNLVVFDLDAELFRLPAVFQFSSGSPGISFMAITAELNRSKYFRIIQAQVRGCVLKSASMEELKSAILQIIAGKIAFPEKVMSQNVIFSGIDRINNELTEREAEVLQLLCEGFSNLEIAERLHLSQDTIKWHRSNILIKSGCKNVLSLYKYALKQNWIPVP